MAKPAVLVVVASILVLGSACGGSSEAPAAGGSGSCSVTTRANNIDMRVCADYPAQYAAAGVSFCQSKNSPWSNSACSTTNRMGTCSIYQGPVVAVTITFYLNSGYTLSDAQMSCMLQSGNWTTG